MRASSFCLSLPPNIKYLLERYGNLSDSKDTRKPLDPKDTRKPFRPQRYENLLDPKDKFPPNSKLGIFSAIYAILNLFASLLIECHPKLTFGHRHRQHHRHRTVRSYTSPPLHHRQLHLPLVVEGAEWNDIIT